MGAVFRFGVCDGIGRQSSVFRVWQGKNTSDIYVASRSAAGSIKASLHQSGLWQVSLTKQYFDRDGTKFFPDGNRHFSRWPRPDEVIQGVTRAFTIYFPTSELGVSCSKIYHKKVHWLPAAHEGYVVAAELMLASPNAPLTSWKSEDGAELPVIDHTVLPNGEILLLVYRVVTMDTCFLSGVEAIRKRIRENRSITFEGSECNRRLSNARIVLMGNTQDGTHFFVDASLASG